jgi:hypothetical protein
VARGLEEALPLTGRAGVDSSTKSPGPVLWLVCLLLARRSADALSVHQDAGVDPVRPDGRREHRDAPRPSDHEESPYDHDARDADGP